MCIPNSLSMSHPLLPCLFSCQLHFLLSSESDLVLFLTDKLRFLALLLVEGDLLVMRKCLKFLAMVMDQ